MKRIEESADSYAVECVYVPYSRRDTEWCEAFRDVASYAPGQLEGRAINAAVDAARSTLERLRFSTTRSSVERRSPSLRIFFDDSHV